MSTILVLGANGFLGRSIAHRLILDGHLVHLHGRRGTSDERDVDGFVHELDLESATTADVLRMLDLSGAEVVVNCTGATSGERADLYLHNVAVVERLLAAVQHRAAVRLVHLGSAAEYGPTSRRPVREDDTALPISEYGRSKLAGTQRVIEGVTAFDGHAVVLRVFNPVGANQPPSSAVGRAVVAMRDALRRREPGIELGRLDSWRDYIGTGDVAGAVAAVATDPTWADPVAVFNVGLGRATSTSRLIEELAEVAGFGGAITERDTFGSSRSEGLDWQQADISALTAATGWQPVQSLHDALVDAWTSADDHVVDARRQAPARSR
ncbi:MAG: UDP-glucose 4-epimerase [Actinomycetota bacterium]